MASSSLRSCVGQKEQLHGAERLKKKEMQWEENLCVSVSVPG